MKEDESGYKAIGGRPPHVRRNAANEFSRRMVHRASMIYRPNQSSVQGVDNDDTIKVYRNGGADPEGGQPGDLYVTVKVREDPVFRREKANIHVDVVLNVMQIIDPGGWVLLFNSNPCISEEIFYVDSSSGLRK